MEKIRRSFRLIRASMIIKVLGSFFLELEAEAQKNPFEGQVTPIREPPEMYKVHPTERTPKPEYLITLAT